MDGNEFRQRIRKLAKKRNVTYEYKKKRGKGSHSTLCYDDHKTTVKKGEIGEGLLNAMLRQLGLAKKDLDDE